MTLTGHPQTTGSNPFDDDTPVARELYEIVRTAAVKANAHATTAHADALKGSVMHGQYEALFGRELLQADGSWAALVLGGSFFAPNPDGPLATSCKITSKVYGADLTQYISDGTTLTNRVPFAVAALLDVDVMFIDRNSHVSVHTEARDLDAEFEYFENVPELKSRMRALQAKRPNARVAVMLTGAPYGDTVMDSPKVMRAIMEIDPDALLFFDEAWGASHAFHPRLREHTALEGARQMRAERPELALRLLVSQSVHKSMNAMRQGSWLHVVGDDVLQAAVRDAVFALHTTSPSLPILASLELARARMVLEGEELLDRSIRLADDLRNQIATDPALTRYRLAPAPDRHLNGGYVTSDPTKVLIDMRRLGLSSSDFKKRLLANGIHVAWVHNGYALIIVTIGFDEAAMHRLLEALRTIADAVPAGLTGEVSTGLMIPYPPGVPILATGEPITDAILTDIQHLRDTGSEMHWLPGRRPRR